MMRRDHANLRRPLNWLAIGVAISALLMLTACGSAAQSESAAPESVEPQSQNAAEPSGVQIDEPAQGDAPAGSAVHGGDSGHGTAESAELSATVVINVPIQNRSTTLTRDDLRVSQGDTALLKFTSDEPGEVHLHGYDLTVPVSPGQPAELQFATTTAGAFGINFHAFAQDSMPMDAGDDGNSGAGPGDHGSMDHGPTESSVPIEVGVVAMAEDTGAVNVHIVTDGWRWAPEEVNQDDTPGAGHAHIYVDGVKLNRVYGPYYHIPNLDAGDREIRVTLNANSHGELTYAGQPLEATTMVAVPEAVHQRDTQPEAAPATRPMSVSVTAHEDPSGGYNLEVNPVGFTFDGADLGADLNRTRVDGSGEGYAQLYVDGVKTTRLYGPWLKLDALGAGAHDITVHLVTSDHRPYAWDGNLVEASITVHGTSDGAPKPTDASDHSGHDDPGHEHDAAAEIVAEVHLGNLEVYP